MDGESTSSYRYRTTCLAMHSSPEIRSCAACKAKSNPHPTKKDALLKAYAVRMHEPGRCLVRTIVGSSSSSVYTYSTPERGCFAAKYTIA
jgi:hypothetical protein